MDDMNMPKVALGCGAWSRGHGRVRAFVLLCTCKGSLSVRTRVFLPHNTCRVLAMGCQVRRQCSWNALLTRRDFSLLMAFLAFLKE